MEKKITYKDGPISSKRMRGSGSSKNKLALIGSIIILLMIAAAILAPSSFRMIRTCV